MGKIFYLMGKSASGKDTIYKEVRERLPELKTIVIYTTRPIRQGERDGVEYHFVDEKRLHDLTVEKYPDLPYFMFGHSMGSIITRQFLAKYGSELTGAIICGTVGPDALPCEEGVKLLKPLVDSGKGAEADPALLGNLMGGLFSRIEEGVKIGNEWICHDPYVQIDHATDPFDAFTKPTCNEALLQFVEMIAEVNTLEWAEKVPKIPLYNIAGAEDPCGSFGEGVKLVSKWLEETGHDVTTKLYEGYRHEIHNYNDLKDEVEAGIVAFLNKALG